MNKRIQELAYQAAHGMLSYDAEGEWRLSEREVERFALRLIDECCLKLWDMDEKAQGNHNYYKHAALKIQEHFGVKDSD